MVEERVHQSQAATLLQVSPSQITEWRAKSSSLQQATGFDPVWSTLGQMFIFLVLNLR
jgi:hypothetical protein